MGFFERNPYIPANLDLYGSSTTKACPLGTTITLGDGRKFVYALNSSAAILPIATLCQQPVTLSHVTLAVPTLSAVGETHLHVTLATTAVTLNYYAEGYAVVDTPVGSAGGGTFYKIKSHPAQTSATGALQLELYDAIRIATTVAGSKVTLLSHPCSNVVASPASAHTGIDVGVTTFAIPVSSYFWAQVKGPCSVLINGTVVIGGAVIKDAAAAGSVAPNTETTFLPHLGTVMSVPSDDLYAIINLAIPGY